MTNNEFLILKYLKQRINVSYADLLNEFRDSSSVMCPPLFFAVDHHND